MTQISDILTPESSPAVEAQLVAARKRAGLTPSARELVIELSLATGFLIAALAIGLLAPVTRPFEWGSALVLMLGAAVSSKIVFSVGSTYTAPIQLAWVPMLFVLPTGWAPLALARRVSRRSGPRHVRRAPLAREAGQRRLGLLVCDPLDPGPGRGRLAERHDRHGRHARRRAGRPGRR